MGLPPIAYRLLGIKSRLHWDNRSPYSWHIRRNLMHKPTFINNIILSYKNWLPPTILANFGLPNPLAQKSIASFLNGMNTQITLLNRITNLFNPIKWHLWWSSLSFHRNLHSICSILFATPTVQQKMMRNIWANLPVWHWQSNYPSKRRVSVLPSR